MPSCPFLSVMYCGKEYQIRKDRVWIKHGGTKRPFTWRSKQGGESKEVFESRIAEALEGATSQEQTADMSDGTTSSSQTGMGHGEVLDDNTSRSRAAPDFFSKSAHSSWSAYELDRCGQAHSIISAAQSEEPELMAELDKLFARCRVAVLSATGSSAAVRDSSSVDEEMTAAATSSLNSALIELLAASRDSETAHIWADPDASMPPAVDVPAQLGGRSGHLAVAPPSLVFTPDKGAASEGLDPLLEEPISWPLSSFVGVDDDPEAHTLNELRLLQGDDDGLLFRFENSIKLAVFERTLRVAAMSAHAAPLPSGNDGGTGTVPQPSQVASSRPSGGGIADEPPKRQRMEEPRVRRGRELRESLAQVAKLFSRDKTKQARAAFAAVDGGAAAGTDLTRLRAGELRSQLFTYGSLNLTKAVLARFLDMKEVKLLLDEDFQKSRQELADAKTATAMLKAAKHFLNKMLAAKGRKSDAERNAFWASIVSLMPADLIENR